MALRVVFMGTPEFSAATLQALVEAGHDIAAVYSQPPRPAGRRGLELTKSPVHQLAETLGIDVRTPQSLKSEEEQDAFRALNADVTVVVAYGLLLPTTILEGTRLGAYNGHASLLPRWRGAAPIQRAIMAGDAKTGMMVMKMDEGLDTGPVAMTQEVAISADMTAGELHDALMETGASLMVDALAALEKGELALTPQSDQGATYAKKISKEETRINWAKPAIEIHNQIRGLSPFPGAWCEMTTTGKAEAERIKILRSSLASGKGQPGEVLDDQLTIACGEGTIRLIEVQRAGSKAMDAQTFLRGAKLNRGDFLS